jgi:thymidylate synthase
MEDNKLMNTGDVLNIFKDKYKNGIFRTIGNAVQQSKTIEIQNVQFEVDKPWIVREPNEEYFQKELQWYQTESLNVHDIPGGAPTMWKACATPDGYINSNYGWMIWSKDNGEQYKHCLQKLIEDPHTREACMIYNRPSMQEEYKKNGMHDFCCTYAVQCFLNEDESGRYHLKYIVYMRSNDAVFGFDNDALWHMHVQERLSRDLFGNLPVMIGIPGPIICDPIVWNAGSLHIYERHFKFLEN